MHHASCIIHTAQEPFAVSQLHSLLNLLCTSWDHSPVACAFWSIFVTLASACTGLDGPETNKVQRNFRPPGHAPSNSVYNISMEYIHQVQSPYLSYSFWNALESPSSQNRKMVLKTPISSSNKVLIPSDIRSLLPLLQHLLLMFIHVHLSSFHQFFGSAPKLRAQCLLLNESETLKSKARRRIDNR